MEFLVTFLNVFFSLFELLILARIILSWIGAPLPTFIGRFLMETTEPYLGLFRKIIPPLGMIDFSPIIAIFVLELIADLVLRGIALL